MDRLKKNMLNKHLVPFKNYISKTKKTCYRLSLSSFSSIESNNQLGAPSVLELFSTIPKDSNGDNMVLFAQVDFNEINLPSPFPNKGILQFYVNKQFGNPNTSTDSEQFAINFFETIPEEAIESNIYMLSPKLKCIPTPLKFSGTIIDEPISAFDYRFNHYFNNINRIISADEQTFHDIYTQYFLGAEHKIGGYPYFIEEDFRKHDCSLQKYDTLLLQIITDDLHEIEYRDSGVISFFIEEKKLRNLDFSDVYMHREHY